MITRTPTEATGGVTNSEMEAFSILVKKWTANAFQTGRADKEKLTDAIHRLYAAAGLEKPRVVVVPSPLVMALSYGLAAGWWYLKKNRLLRLFAATRAATLAATFAATRDATLAATVAATVAATLAATDAATRDAKCHVDMKWLYGLARYFGGEKADFLISCISKWTNVYQGGNMWISFSCYAEAMREVIGLKGLSCWEKFKAYEDASRFGGIRLMHEEFCVVSDFPDIMKVDEKNNNRPHCTNGPSHRWSDGFEIYHLNGVRVPKWLVMTDVGKITPEQALNEKNVDVQREIIRKIGVERLLKASKAKVVDVFKDPRGGRGSVYTLYQMKIGDAINRKYLHFEHASLPGVFYAQPVHPSFKKAIHARAAILGLIPHSEDKVKFSEKELLARMPSVVS